MDRVIVYVDDAGHAQQVLAPLVARAAASDTHWVLVACAPRMTHRISKWVSHSARENWRAKWADKLFDQMLPALRARHGRVTTVVAKGPLGEVTEQLQSGYPVPAQVVDARRPKSDVPGDAAAPRGRQGWSAQLPGTLGSLATGFGALWVLSFE